MILILLLQFSHVWLLHTTFYNEHLCNIIFRNCVMWYDEMINKFVNFIQRRAGYSNIFAYTVAVYKYIRIVHTYIYIILKMSMFSFNIFNSIENLCSIEKYFIINLNNEQRCIKIKFKTHCILRERKNRQ